MFEPFSFCTFKRCILIEAAGAAILMLESWPARADLMSSVNCHPLHAGLPAQDMSR
jgi:hypothetical protein